MSRADTCVVAGSGPEFFKDFVRARELAPEADVMAVNMTGLWVPKAHYLVSLHAALLGPLRALRLEFDWCGQGTTPCVTVSHTPHPGVDQVVPKPAQGIAGTSSLYAVRVALSLGYPRIVLAGIPMDNSGRFFDPPWATYIWPHEVDRGPWELANKHEFEGRVTSVSGWTAQLLGESEGGPT